jgi:Uma2 family endonuclease
MSPSGSRVIEFQGSIFFELKLWNKKEKKGICFESQAGFHLPDSSVLSPDVSWLSSTRWNALTNTIPFQLPIYCVMQGDR